MILAYVTMGIADLSQGAGKLLLITVALAYGSTLIAGSASYLVSSSLFPHFMSEGALDQIAATADASLTPFFSITLEPVMDTLSAVALAFVMGLCLSSMRGKEMGNSLYNGMSDFSKIIDKDHQRDDEFQKGTEKSGKGYNKATEAFRKELAEQDTYDDGNDQLRHKSDLDFFLFHLDSFLLSMNLFILHKNTIDVLVIVL